MQGLRVLLGSNSPRRRELLAAAGVDFEVRVVPDVDESYPEWMPVREVAEYLACKKAEAYMQDLGDDELLITADTVVLLDGKVLGKPEGYEEAVQMLKELSGKTHEVLTGVCMTMKEKRMSFTEVSSVRFSQLSDREIEFYVERYRPYDKAGAYGIQEWIGYIGAECVSGSFYNIMGLPTQRVYQELKRFGCFRV
ncbi:Maf-like protein yhdE [Bacteroidales bacterium Barb4]|nr:Maf-like protein yhdE [Bacteroidales bacterium Barb4]